MFRNFLKDLLLVITEKNTRRDKQTIPRDSQYDVFNWFLSFLNVSVLEDIMWGVIMAVRGNGENWRSCNASDSHLEGILLNLTLHHD